MKYLLDTNVISAVSPLNATRRPDFADWLDQHSSELYLSVVTATEIRDGVAMAERRGASRKATALREWWDLVEGVYVSRFLPFDLEVATIAGPLTDLARARGFDPGFGDVAIAATAKMHGLTILTRNVKDFAPLGIDLIDPFVTPLD